MSPSPSAVDPDTPRYVPDRALPAYRHALGQTPHPRTHPRGHSFGLPEVTATAPLAADAWQSNEMYLFGVDLYNFAYWWEAHEQWEALWRREPDRGTDTASFLQGLIQLSAAMLQWQAGNWRGFSRLLGKGAGRLKRVVSRLEGGGYLGVDPLQVTHHYQVLLEDRSGAKKAGAPVLLLSGTHGPRH